MLKKITFDNFKSFMNKTTIDLGKTNYKYLENNADADGVLKGALFVGANAAGKSNILIAIKILLDLLFAEYEVDSDLLLCLSSKKDEYTIEYEFKIEGEDIKYIISKNIIKRIITEKLYINDELKMDRMGITAKSYLKDNMSVTYGEDEVNKNGLFLRTLFFNTRFAGNEVLIKWFEYLQNSVYVNAYSRNIVPYMNKSLVIDKYLAENGTDRLNKFFKNYNLGFEVKYENNLKNNRFVLSLFNKEEKTVFITKNDTKLSLPLELESLGNQTLVNLIPAFLNAVDNQGMLIIDEFSSGFHNMLEELLVKYFMKNANKSQMFFVSHSTNLISNSLLRPDQIFGVQFDSKKGSQVIRFSEKGPRLAQNLEKMYLSGRFDAIPEYVKVQ